MSQSVGRAGGHQKPVNKSSKTAWIKRKLKSAADEDLSQQFLHEQTRSPPVGGSQGGNWSAQQTHPQQKGPGFDQDGNYTGDTYVYSPESDKLERQSTVQHNLNHRDLSSFSSTSAQASTAWYADGESREEQRSSSVARRPLSPSAILPSAAVLSAAERPSDSERLRQLSHIETWLLGAIQKNPELAGPEFESAEDTIVRIVDQYERLFASKNILQPDDYAGAKRTNLVKARDEVRAANTVLQDNNKKLEKELTKLRDNNSKLESTRSKLEGTRSVLLEKTARMNKEYKELEKRMERDSETLNSQIARLRFQKHEMTTSHTDKLRTLQISKEREIDDLKRGYEEKLRFLQVDRDTHLSGWTQSHKAHEALQADLEARQRSAKADAEDRMREFEGNCDRKMQKERRDYEERIRSLEADKERLNKSLQEAMSHKDKALLSQKQELAKLHEDEKKNLQTVIEDFKVATSSREHFKGLTDSEAAGRYTRLATKIEDFSRLEWDFSKEHDWPLTEDRMRVLSNNSRKLKQQIVQNSLWVCLYHYIFQSPFQIMGNEGRELDEQWTSIYAAGRYRIKLFEDLSLITSRSVFF
jgi:hypothetical protein